MVLTTLEYPEDAEHPRNSKLYFAFAVFCIDAKPQPVILKDETSNTVNSKMDNSLFFIFYILLAFFDLYIYSLIKLKLNLSLAKAKFEGDC